MSIDNLFTKQQWRELELITLLSETKNPLYYKDACQLLDCSVLTLQSCITNSVFMEDLGKLFYKDSQFHIHYNHRSEEHTSELQSRQYLVCRLLLEKKKTNHLAIF